MAKKELLVSDDQLVLLLATALTQGDKDLCNALSVSRAANLTLEQLSAVTKPRINSYLRTGRSNSPVVNQLMGDQQLNSNIRGILQDNKGKYVFKPQSALLASLKQVSQKAGITLNDDWIICYKPTEPILDQHLTEAQALLVEIRQSRKEQRAKEEKHVDEGLKILRKLHAQFRARFSYPSNYAISRDQHTAIERLCCLQVEATFRTGLKRRRYAVA
jgi:hypothetical protein